MTPVEFLESRITNLIPDDIGSRLMYNSNIKKAKAMETVESMRVEKLETLAKLLATSWFYGDWKWETPNERVQQMLMQELGYYPFKDEDEMIHHTQIEYELYKQAAEEIDGWREPSKDIALQTEILDEPTCKKNLPVELSDEEIEKGAKDWYDKEGPYKPSTIALKTWGYAIKWYREQFKKK